jgi:hypothetical protein
VVVLQRAHCDFSIEQKKMEQVAVEADKKCTFSIDRGGTFTDIYAEVHPISFI